LKVKLDENIPGAVAGVLRSRGHDVDTVLEESLGGRDDPPVLSAPEIASRPDDQRVPTVVARWR
jgi:hypothetical protein